MPAPSPALSVTIDDAPLEVLECALDLMIEEEQFSTALAFLRHHPEVLGHLRHLDVNSPLIDFPDFRRLYPRLAFHLQNRRRRARALSDLDGRSVDEQVKALEERLAQIRREVEAHAIGAPFQR